MTKENVLVLLAMCRSNAPEDIELKALRVRTKADATLIQEHFSTLRAPEQWNIRAAVDEAVSSRRFRMERAIMLGHAEDVKKHRSQWQALRKLQDCLYV